MREVEITRLARYRGQKRDVPVITQRYNGKSHIHLIGFCIVKGEISNGTKARACWIQHATNGCVCGGVDAKK